MDAQPKYRGARSLLAEGAEGIHAEDCSKVNLNMLLISALCRTKNAYGVLERALLDEGCPRRPFAHQ